MITNAEQAERTRHWIERFRDAGQRQDDPKVHPLITQAARDGARSQAEMLIAELDDYCRALVVNVRSGQAFDVYVGRRAGGFVESKWGNPFHIGKDGTREDVIAKYVTWLLGRPDLMAALPELRDKKLGCWCAPALMNHQGWTLCHGLILARLANGLPLERTG